MTNFASDKFFCRLFLFTEDYFYRPLIFTGEYSNQYFFYKQEHYFNLKIPLVYLFDFKFD